MTIKPCRPRLAQRPKEVGMNCGYKCLSSRGSHFPSLAVCRVCRKQRKTTHMISYWRLGLTDEGTCANQAKMTLFTLTRFFDENTSMKWKRSVWNFIGRRLPINGFPPPVSSLSPFDDLCMSWRYITGWTFNAWWSWQDTARVHSWQTFLANCMHVELIVLISDWGSHSNLCLNVLSIKSVQRCRDEQDRGSRPPPKDLPLHHRVRRKAETAQKWPLLLPPKEHPWSSYWPCPCPWGGLPRRAGKLSDEQEVVGRKASNTIMNYPIRRYNRKSVSNGSINNMFFVFQQQAMKIHGVWFRNWFI